MQITILERAFIAQHGPQEQSDSGEGNRDGDLNICQGKEADIAFFLASDKNKKDQKMFEAK